MHHFFVAPELLAGSVSTVLLPDKLAHQIRDVLHLAVGEELILFDNSGDEIRCEVVKSNRSGVEVAILSRQPRNRESSVRIILCSSLLKTARFEWVLEKGTELGVAVFAPMLSRRSTAGLEEAGTAKIQRWQRIIQESAEQCGRPRLPELWPIRALTQVLEDLPSGAIALMAWEEAQKGSLRQALQASNPPAGSSLTVVLLIGPEGGLTVEEVALAQRYGVEIVTLGRRILRAETAAIAAVANVLYELEAIEE